MALLFSDIAESRSSVNLQTFMNVVSGLANKRLVIFGCGYVGTALAEIAIRAKLRITAVTRNAEKAAALSQLGLETVIADIASETWHSQIADPIDYVVVCLSAGGGGLPGYQRSYVEGMRSILSWAARISNASFVYTSSTSVYPQGEGQVVDETAVARGDSPSSTLLLEAEEIFKGVERGGLNRWCILRIAGIYGPRRHHLLDQLRNGERTLRGSGEHRLNLAHRDDIATALWLALTTTPTGVQNTVINIADDAPVRKGDLVEWLARKIGQQVPHFDGVSGSTRRGGLPVPERVISNAKAKKILGWRPAYPDFRAGYDMILTEQ